MKRDFEKVYPKMTTEEREEYFMYTMCGMHDRANNVVLMGSVAYNRVVEYEQKMVDKYLPEILKNDNKIVPLKKKSLNKNQQIWKKSWKRK